MTVSPESTPTDFAWLLRRALRAHRAAIARALAKAGYTELPPLALWTIDALRGSERTAGELATALGVSKQAVSQAVELLVSRGYLERAADASDRRRIILRLSARGEAAAAVIAAACDEIEARARGTVGAGALTHARAALAALAGDGAAASPSE